jgi:hypothetical protein
VKEGIGKTVKLFTNMAKGKRKLVNYSDNLKHQRLLDKT